jgi:hypothetical protein
MANDTKVAAVDLYVGSIIVHHAGTEVSSEDVKAWHWEDFVTDKDVPTDETADRATGAGTVAENPATPGAAKRASEKTNPGA